MPTPTCLVMCIQASRAHFRGGEGIFRESKDDWLASEAWRCSDMDGVKRHTGEARKERSGATGKGGTRGYPSAGRNERAVRAPSYGETTDWPAASRRVAMKICGSVSARIEISRSRRTVVIIGGCADVVLSPLLFLPSSLLSLTRPLRRRRWAIRSFVGDYQILCGNFRPINITLPLLWSTNSTWRRRCSKFYQIYA